MSMRYELRNGLANVLRRPGFLMSVVVTLGVTMGTLLSMFAVNYLLLVKPLPYPDADRLHVAVGERLDGDTLSLDGFYPYPGAEYVYEHQRAFERLALLNYEEALITSLPERPKVYLASATPELFELTGMNMARGAPFTSQDAREVVISHALWQTQFQGRADILQQTLTIGEHSFRIVGVAAEDYVEPRVFQPNVVASVWSPWKLNAWNDEFRNDWQSATGAIRLIGRLQPGMNAKQAGQALTELLNSRFKQETTGVGFLRSARINVNVKSFNEIITGDSSATTLMLLAGSLSLLLIACVNVGNLLLSRAAENQRRLAIQATLGANPMHIFRSVFAEVAVLMGVATVFALGVSGAVSALLRRTTAGLLPRIEELSLGVSGFVFAVLLALAMALTFAAIISWSINYRSLNTLLQSSGKGTGLQISKPVRALLVASQIALASMLLVGIFSLLAQSIRVIEKPAGFATDDIMHFSLNSGTQQFSREERIQYIESIREKLLQHPGVNLVSNTLFAPMMTGNWTSLLTNDLEGNGRLSPNTNLIDDKYFEMLGLAFVKGRNFTASEVKDKSTNIIVSETLAAHLAPGEEILGKRFYWQNREDPYTVIGVVRDISIPRSEATDELYATRTTGFNFLVRTEPGHTLSKADVAGIVRDVNGNLSVYSHARLDRAYAELLALDYAVVAIAMVLAFITMGLAALGVYGVMSYGVRLRQYELGIRMAIGANPRDILRLVFKDNSVPVAVGLIAGCALALGAYFAILALFTYAVPIAVLPAALTVLLIIAMGALACYVPGRRIVSRFPIWSLRSDSA